MHTSLHACIHPPRYLEVESRLGDSSDPAVRQRELVELVANLERVDSATGITRQWNRPSSNVSRRIGIVEVGVVRAQGIDLSDEQGLVDRIRIAGVEPDTAQFNRQCA